MLVLWVVMGLTGCIHYAGMHATATPYQPQQLNQPHHYAVPHGASQRVAHDDWWSCFHDAQLNQLIETALENAPTIAIAKNRIQKSAELANQSEAALWPNIDLYAYRTRERFAKYGLVAPPFSNKTFNITDIGLNFNYEIDFWGKNREQLTARVSDSCATLADYAATRLILSTAVASHYFEWQRALKKQQLAQAILMQRERILKIVRDRLSHGIQSEIPVKTAQTDQEAARLALQQYTENAALIRHRLALLLGDNPLTTTIEVPRFNHKHPHITVPDDLPLALIGQRPDIAAARARAEAAAHRVKVAKARFYPSINLNLLFSYQSIFFNKLFNHESQNNAATGAIDLPIFDAGARRANLGVRYAEYDAAVNQYNQSILIALKEVADQLVLLKTVGQQLRTQGAAVAASQRNDALVRLRYQHGIIDYLPVLTMRETYLEQQMLLVDYQARQLLAQVAMIKALGGDFTIHKEQYDCCHTT